jgi:type IV pilus assembly protein PilQ
MKRILTLVAFLAVLGFQAALAQPSSLPADARFDEPVAFSTGSNGESLRAMITALARSIGLTPVVDNVPDRIIVYDIGDPKPFRQVWELVLTLNDLDFVLQENDVIVVGTPDALARLRAPAAPDEPLEHRTYFLNNPIDQVTPVVRRVAPDATIDTVPGRNAIFVIATPSDHEAISSVLAEVDLPRDDAEVVTADDATFQRFYRVQNQVDQVATILRRAVPGVSIETLPGTDAIVVVGTEAQQEAVTAALDEFDRPADIVPLEQRTYFLSNAQAERLSQTLQATTLVSAESGEPLDAFSVVAEPRTNSLIVTGTAQVQRRLAELIAQLDGPQRQVNIQVRIQEITRRTAFDLGIDWGAGFGNLSAQILSGGLNFIFDTTQVISSLNILAVLDTLETQGLSRRVDDSNITVLDNGTGTIQSGGVIFITLPGANENIERTIPYGVQVDVTPRIAADGRITLEVEAKVEDVLSTTNDPTFLNLSSRNVNTTVTVEQGQTILLGGLLQNQFSTTRQRIPIIGSLPLIGDLFGRTITEEDNVDLLVILTAQVID